MVAQSSRALWRQISGFAVVGVMGFVVDAGLFYALTHGVGLAAIPARLLAFFPATLVTWWINRSMVFRPRTSSASLPYEYGRYLAVQSTGIAINFTVFSVAVYLWPTAPSLLALACGSGVAMVGNFVGARWLVFKR